jgi:hypothetical protein
MTIFLFVSRLLTCFEFDERRRHATAVTYLDNEVESLFGEEFHSSVLLA